MAAACASSVACWSKAAATKGQFALAGALGRPARIDAVSLGAAGLKAEGGIALTADGGLDKLRLTLVWTPRPVQSASP